MKLPSLFRRTPFRLTLLFLALFAAAAAAILAYVYVASAQEARARALFQDVRCMVCQNESIDDSNAELAADLRRMVREEIQSGKTDAQVRSGLIDRYGEFVLLKPAFSWSNAALWGAPAVVVLIGLWLLVANFRNRPPDETLSPEEEAELKRLSGD